MLQIYHQVSCAYRERCHASRLLQVGLHAAPRVLRSCGRALRGARASPPRRWPVRGGASGAHAYPPAPGPLLDTRCCPRCRVRPVLPLVGLRCSSASCRCAFVCSSGTGHCMAAIGRAGSPGTRSAGA